MAFTLWKTALNVKRAILLSGNALKVYTCLCLVRANAAKFKESRNGRQVKRGVNNGISHNLSPLEYTSRHPGVAQNTEDILAGVHLVSHLILRNPNRTSFAKPAVTLLYVQ